jgi:hypothetical protein
MAFDLDRFVSDCRHAVAEDRSHKLVREVVAASGQRTKIKSSA